MKEIFDDYKDMKKRHKKEKTTSSMDYAIKNISDAGYPVNVVDKNCISFYFKGSVVIFYPYTGWASGKTITDGRGLNKLLKQINGG